MSQENVEIVRASIEAFQRGDVSRSLSYVDPYVVLDSSRVRKLDVSVAYGQDGVTQAMRHYIGAFEDYDVEVAFRSRLRRGPCRRDRNWTRKEERRTRPALLRLALHRDRRQDRPDHSVFNRDRSPPSRRVVGVVQKYRFGRKAAPVREVLRRRCRRRTARSSFAGFVVRRCGEGLHRRRLRSPQ
jgi:hypothetical protein